MSVMNAVAATPSVKRVVLTSSVASILSCGKEKPAHYSGNDWSIPENQSGYLKSKTLAEKAAWDFLKTPEGSHINLVTICPGLIVGPPLTPTQTGSVQYLTSFKEKGKDGAHAPRSLIEVTDVALAHLNSAKKDQIENQRFLMVESCVLVCHLGQILNGETLLIESEVNPDTFDCAPVKDV